MVKRQREVPVKQRDPGLYARSEERVDEAIVKVEAGGVEGTGAVWEHARPGYAEPIRLEADLFHQRDVFAVAAVVVASDVAALAAPDCAGPATEHVPHARAFAVGVVSALDLVRGRCCA